MIVSTTLANAGTDRALLDKALRSGAAVADTVLLLDTSTARPWIEPIDGVQTIHIGWRDDFAWARNRALKEAEKAGGTWAMHVDSDEELSLPSDVRGALAMTDAPVAFLQEKGGAYAKIRFVRLPAVEKYVGRIHEVIAGLGPVLPGHFAEAPKTPEQLAKKFQRDVRILREETKRDPGNGRWHFYLARTLQDSGDLAGALPAYEKCARVSAWDEERAWACRNAAEVCMELRDFDKAVRLAEQGLRHRADFKELWAVLARAHTWLDHQVQAARFARIGISIQDEPRLIFRDPYWAGSGLYRVLAHALDRLGDASGAAAAREEESL